MSKGLFSRLEGELQAREKSPGLLMSDLLAMADPECGLLNWMIRQGQVALPEVMAFLGQGEDRTRSVLTGLRDKGYVREIEIHGMMSYRVRLAPKRGKTMPANLWAALDGKVEREEGRK